MLDKFLRDLVHGEFSIGKSKLAFLDILLTVCITGAAVMIRKSIFGISGNPGLEGGTTMLIYCVLDFVLAFLMAVFVWKTTKNCLKTVGVYSLAVIWPAIAANSALNGGTEVAFAVILVALLCVISVKKANTMKTFWLVTILTCIFQSAQGDDPAGKLTNFWPNIYTLFSETGFYYEYKETGKLLVIGILLIIFYYISKKEVKVTPELYVASGLFCSLFISAFYPFMNYRSGLLANVFAILLFIQNQKKFYVPMAMCIISYVSYGYFYNGKIGVFFWMYALGLIVLMLDAGVYLYKQLHTGKMA
ncbi:MAG: hypothetical protein IJ024_05790 [Lachnospiraceae bacterium]|nr:hypothetical protein [Lachnospiraceae bacterium]